MSVTASLPALLQPPTLPVRRFTVAEYRQMIQTGILGEDDPVELLEGLVVPKMPHNPPHDATIDLAREVLQAQLPPEWRIRVQSAITTPDSQPEPDLAIVRGPASRYLDHHPLPQEVALVVEVADTSLSRDRLEKARLYARAGLVCYWIVNLVERQVEVYADPSGPDPGPAYRRREDYKPGATVLLNLEGLAGISIRVSELLP